MEQAPGREGLFCYLLPQSPEHFNELNNLIALKRRVNAMGVYRELTMMRSQRRSSVENDL